MIEVSTVIWIALFALFLGVTIPVLVQMRATLKELERRMESTGTRVDKILDDSQIVAHRLARMSSGLEGGEESIRGLLEATGDLARVMNRMTGWMGIASTVGAAVGPVVASAVQAYRSPEDAEPEEEAVEDVSAAPGSEWVPPESMNYQQSQQQRSRA